MREMQASREKKERESKEKAKALQGKEAFRRKRENKGKKAPDTALPFGCPFPVLQGSDRKHPYCGERAVAAGQVCLLPGSRSELGVGSKAAMGAGDLPQKG